MRYNSWLIGETPRGLSKLRAFIESSFCSLSYMSGAAARTPLLRPPLRGFPPEMSSIQRNRSKSPIQFRCDRMGAYDVTKYFTIAYALGWVVWVFRGSPAGIFSIPHQVYCLLNVYCSRMYQHNLIKYSINIA